jgi:vacuolar-type H+-ATPase subunit I/STV1
MPLPVIFKFLTDTSGTRFDEVTDGLDGVKVSSQKAGQAVRSFTSVLRSGQEPVTALADSFSNLTRAFGLGVGATIAVVGVVEVIKSLTAESEKLNSVSDQINSTLKTFQESAGSLDLGGAITQVKSLGKAFEDARTKLGQRTDILGKVGTTIADTFFGGSRERAEAGLESLKAAQGQARFAASVALDKRIEAVQAGKVSKFAAETLAITEKYAKERRQAVDAGLIESDLRKLDILEIEELTKVARKEIDERGKAIQEQLDQEKQTTQRINELRIRDEEKIKNLRREGTSELLKGIESLNRGRLAGATPLLNRAGIFG